MWSWDMHNYRDLQHILIGNKSITDRGITFINDAEHEDFMSYSELYNRSVRLLNGLRHAGVKAGHELLFQIDDNRTFIELFWASMLGQMIPVPVTMGVNEESTLKVYKVWNKLNDPYLLYQGDVLEGLSDYVLDNPEWTLQLQEMRSRSLNPEQLMSEGEAMIAEAESESELELDPEQMAFIQFSSGSTGDPKGVILTHSNVIANVRATAESWDLDVIKAALSWIPLTHDMGLISMHILNAYIQINQYIMPSKLFIRNPILWLDKAHEHRISVLYCPNFGYKYLLAYYEQEQDYEWDLSNIQYICNGAEPISRSEEHTSELQ